MLQIEKYAKMQQQNICKNIWIYEWTQVNTKICPTKWNTKSNKYAQKVQQITGKCKKYTQTCNNMQQICQQTDNDDR